MTLFRPGELRIVLLITLGAAFLAILGVVVVSLIKTPRPVSVEFVKDPDESSIYISDFLFPLNPGKEGFSYQLFRPVREKWNAQDIEEFWKDPGVEEIDSLTHENDAFIQEYFDAVP